MRLEPEERERVKRVHQWVTFAGGLVLALGAVAAFAVFLRPSREFPSWLITFAKLFISPKK
jgi:hypothetical protein